jgi:pimeloyl-ACP methyl ester carboxylesterase
MGPYPGKVEFNKILLYIGVIIRHSFRASMSDAMILHFYGRYPFDTVVVHGGPGAAGEMALVAEALAPFTGVIEPYQTALSIEGLIEELISVLKNHVNLPAVLIGFSWGAWLVTLVAAEVPSLIQKLILVSSGPFDPDYSHDIQETRLNRLSPDERNEVKRLSRVLSDPELDDPNREFEQLGLLLSHADTFYRLDEPRGSLKYDYKQFQRIWPEGNQLRQSGALLTRAAEVRCPVIAIHGDYDSHPAEGVRKPLSGAVKDFRFILLDRCGHRPWVEKWARDEFFGILIKELKD